LREENKALKSPHKGRFGEGKMSLWFVSLRQRNEQKQTLFVGKRKNKNKK
jgi:hypothetical protein